MKMYLSDHWGGYTWSEWVPFSSELSDDFKLHIPKKSGVYRIQIIDAVDSIHVGQLMYIGISKKTQNISVYERTRSLILNTLKDTPPKNDPHTAAPCLWAYRREMGFKYAVSVTTDFGRTEPEKTLLHTFDEKRILQCAEDRLLYLYRQETKTNTWANHGHFHPYYQRPRNGEQMICKETPDLNRVRQTASLVSQFPPSSEVQSLQWLNLSWSQWTSLHECEFGELYQKPGVYRLVENDQVIYFGQAVHLANRLKQHRTTYRSREISISVYPIEQDNFPVSIRLNELEADLIGAFYEALKSLPYEQY